MRIVIVLLALTTTAHAHDGYENWKTLSGLSCCNDKDCHPTRAYLHDDGQWRAMHNGQELTIPDRAWLRSEKSPDGRSHICVYGDYNILCFVPGEVRM